MCSRLGKFGAENKEIIATCAAWEIFSRASPMCCQGFSVMSISKLKCLIVFLILILTVVCNFSPDVQFESARGSHQHCIMDICPDLLPLVNVSSFFIWVLYVMLEGSSPLTYLSKGNLSSAYGNYE